jgi:hypothetical protein
MDPRPEPTENFVANALAYLFDRVSSASARMATALRRKAAAPFRAPGSVKAALSRDRLSADAAKQLAAMKSDPGAATFRGADLPRADKQTPTALKTPGSVKAAFSDNQLSDEAARQLAAMKSDPGVQTFRGADLPRADKQKLLSRMR